VLGFFEMPHICDMGQRLYFPSEERHAEDFSTRKNPMASVGSEPAILGPRGQHANHQTTEAAVCGGVNNKNKSSRLYTYISKLGILVFNTFNTRMTMHSIKQWS
jgi:hypothetical protein